MHKFSLILAFAAAAVLPLQAFAQDVCKDAVVKRLKNSRDFSLKVADAMPAADYNYKLTPAQMSFGEQMVHMTQGLAYFLSALKGEKPNPGKPASTNKADIIAFMHSGFDNAISYVESLTPEQISKEYKGDSGASTLMAMLEHTAHHRASAEMYLRAKGITPPGYMD